MMMKNISLVAVAAALLLAFGVAQAGDDKAKNIIDQNLSKRPYQEAPSVSNTNKTDNWEGATLVADDNTAEKPVVSKHKQLRIHMLGRRPYIEDVR
jgi:hypothetical protein